MNIDSVSNTSVSSNNNRNNKKFPFIEIIITFVTLLLQILMMIQKPKFKVLYYKDAQKFLSKIDVETKEKILENVDKARYTLDPKLLKKLTGDIWEFRTLYKGKHYRMLAFWDKKNPEDTLIIATHGFIKKVNKVPRKEVEKTKKIMDIYFDNKDN